MALTNRELLEAREALAEHRWKQWNADDGTNETSVSVVRYVAGVNEVQLDAFREYLRRWVSTRNQSTFKFCVSELLPADGNGRYLDSGESSFGHAIWRHEAGTFEFRVALSAESGAYYWQFIRLSDGAVQWISSAGAAVLVEATDSLDPSDYWKVTDAGVLVPINLGDETLSLSTVLWTPSEIVHEVTDDLEVYDDWSFSDAGVIAPGGDVTHDPADDLMVGDDWGASDVGVIEPVTGEMVVGYDVPEHGIQYRSVKNPMVNDGKVLDGIYRMGPLRTLKDDGSYGRKGSWVIVQTLHLELNIAAPITESETRWRILRGENRRGSSHAEVLELPYCDPEYAKALSEENTSTSYTNEIYTINGGVLSGTWHNIECSYTIDPKSGYATVRWVVSKQANDDIHFAYTNAGSENVVDFYKFDAADTGLASFETDYYFDDAGNWYISSDGINYSKKNGELEDGVLPTDVPSLGNVRTSIPGRMVTVNITRSEQTRFYRLHAHIEFVEDRSHSLVFYSDAHVLVSEVVQFSDTADLADFSTECQVDTQTGAVVVSDVAQGGDYKSLMDSVDGRSVKLGSSYDAKQGKHRLEARVIQYRSSEVFSTYLRNGQSRVVDFYLFGATRTELNAALLNYYFNDSGDWFYSADGLNYTRKNGVDEAGVLAAENAFNVGTEDTNAEARMVAPPRIERNPAAEVYVLHLHLEYTDSVSSGNSTSYGTPNVMVTDTIVSGAASLPVSAGASAYNAAGTKVTETKMIAPQFDSTRGTWSYISRVIESWAPHADRTSGDAGFVEGPSEIRLDSQALPLARGVGSGYSSAGSWGGGGQGRVRYVADSDGIGSNITSVENTTVQITKKFQPYNITLARVCSVRTSARLYYYVQEPQESQYPALQMVEDKDASDIGSSTYPTVVNVEVTDDEDETFGEGFTGDDGHYLDGADYYGKLVKHAYSDGSFTLSYFQAYKKEKALAVNPEYLDNLNWRKLKFIRTYPATGAGSSTGYGDGTVRVDEAGLKADPAGTLTADDGLYMGHYIITDSAFYTEAIRHRILKVGESVYALVVETVERTPWQVDHINKWILNSEGMDMQYGGPPSNPSLADPTGDSNVPFVM